MSPDGARIRPLGDEPSLDGLRAIAVAMVILYHTWTSTFPGGFAGVEVFFVVSGFLITWLLLQEFERSRQISFRGFYWRRARRLLPALLVMLAGYAVVAIVVAPRRLTGGMLTSIPVVMTYGSNWLEAFGRNFPGLGQMWSLAVEEQFYLIWPLAVWLVVRRGGVRAVGITAAVLAAGSILLRNLLWHGGGSWPRIYCGSDTRAAGILIGCVAACLVATGHVPITKGRALLGAVTGLLGAYLVLYLVGVVPVTPMVSPEAPLTAIDLGTAAALVWLWTPASAGAKRLLGAGPLVHVGRRSYALYLWQPVLLAAATWATNASTWAAPLSIVLALFVAEVSYRYVERPFARRRQPATPQLTASLA